MRKRSAEAPLFKGRPQVVDRRRIVDAALQLGVDNLSMHALARHLRVSPAALYRYVDSKEALLDACMDEFCETVELPERNSDWQSYLHELAHAFRAALQAMPGACQYGLKIGPSTPSAYRILDTALGELFAAGFDTPGAWRAYSLVVDHSFNSVQKEERFAELEQQNGPGGYRVLQLQGDELTPFPNLARSLQAMMPPDFDDSFERTLRALIAGIRHELTAAA